MKYTVILEKDYNYFLLEELKCILLEEEQSANSNQDELDVSFIFPEYKLYVILLNLYKETLSHLEQL